MSIKCCHGCVAPKRRPGCHDRCPDYAKEKAEDVAKKEAIRKRKEIDRGITDQYFRSVNRSLRKRKS